MPIISTRFEAVVNIGMFGLSAYALTWKYLPSANPLTTSLMLGTIHAIGTATENMPRLKNLTQNGFNFSSSSIYSARLLAIFSVTQRFPHHFPRVRETFAIQIVAAIIAHAFQYLARITFVQRDNPGWKGIANLRKLFPLKKNSQQAFFSKADMATAVVVGLLTYCYPPPLFKSSARVTTTLLVTLIHVVTHAAHKTFHAYFWCKGSSDKTKSMFNLRRLLYAGVIGIPPLAIHRVGQLVLTKCPSYFDILGMLSISEAVALQTTHSVSLLLDV
jgi:hypothetical protein